MKTIITALIAATLAATVAVAGVSIADPGDKAPRGAHQDGRGPKGHHGPGPIGPNTTYAEVHNYTNGQAELVRFDQGQIAAIASDSLTLKEADGSSVDIALSSTTKVKMRGNRSATVADLAVDQTVTTVRKNGAAAEMVLVRPVGVAPTQRR